MNEDRLRSPGDDDPIFDDRHDSRLPRNRELLPRGPRSATIEKAGTGVRVSVLAFPPQSIDVAGSSSTEFVVQWAEKVDASTTEGWLAGIARSTVLSPTISTIGSETHPDQPLTAFYADPKYIAGYFYVRGKNAKGEMSEAEPPVRVLGVNTPGGIPNDVEHFQASESGGQHGQMTFSVVSYSFRIPLAGATADRVQFMYRNYPVLNEFAEGESRAVTVAKGSTQTGQLTLPRGVRRGDGTVTIVGTNVTGTGTVFLLLAASAGGDQLRAYGTPARIASVTDNGTMTLLEPWTGPAVVDFADWEIIARVQIFCVAEGINGARREDPENAPSVFVDLDGLLSAPLAPALTLQPVGNAVRAVIEPEAGTDLARALLYRKQGTALSFDKATWEMRHAFAIDTNNPQPFFQWDDSDFTKYERENAVPFCYAATVVNVAEQESEPSTVQETVPRLDAPSDNSPPTTGQVIGPKNQLWNGHINGTAGGPVGVGDAAQDANMGGVAPAGRSRWFGAVTGVGSAPGHVSTNEVVLAMTGGVGSGTSELIQEIGAVDNVTAAKRRIPTWKMHHLQVKVRTSGGQPNGTLFLSIDQVNQAGLVVTSAGCVRRMPDDSIDTSQLWLAVAGSDITTDHQVYHAAFVLDNTVQTALVRVRIVYAVTNWNGVNVIVTEAALMIAEALSGYTPEVDPVITYSRTTGGAPAPPPGYDRDDGTGKPWQPIRVP